MAVYLVNKNKSSDGDHQVHRMDCRHIPERENRVELGNFTSCYAALSAAKEHFDQVNGCYHCAPECHKETA